MALGVVVLLLVWFVRANLNAELALVNNIVWPQLKGPGTSAGTFTCGDRVYCRYSPGYIYYMYKEEGSPFSFSYVMLHSNYQNMDLRGTLPSEWPPFLENLQLYNNPGLSGSLGGLPDTVTNIFIWSTNISGLPSSLPSSLVNLQAYSAKLSGTLPALSAPLRILYVQNNDLLSGTLPRLPESLTSLDVHDCALTGSLPELPASVTSIQVDGNSLTGSLQGGIFNVSSPPLTTCQLVTNMWSPEPDNQFDCSGIDYSSSVASVCSLSAWSGSNPCIVPLFYTLQEKAVGFNNSLPSSPSPHASTTPPPSPTSTGTGSPSASPSSSPPPSQAPPPSPSTPTTSPTEPVTDDNDDKVASLESTLVIVVVALVLVTFLLVAMCIVGGCVIYRQSKQIQSVNARVTRHQSRQAGRGAPGTLPSSSHDSTAPSPRDQSSSTASSTQPQQQPASATFHSVPSRAPPTLPSSSGGGGRSRRRVVGSPRRQHAPPAQSSSSSLPPMLPASDVYMELDLALRGDDDELTETTIVKQEATQLVRRVLGAPNETKRADVDKQLREAAVSSEGIYQRLVLKAREQYEPVTSVDDALFAYGETQLYQKLGGDGNVYSELTLSKEAMERVEQASGGALALTIDDATLRMPPLYQKTVRDGALHYTRVLDLNDVVTVARLGGTLYDAQFRAVRVDVRARNLAALKQRLATVDKNYGQLPRK